MKLCKTIDKTVLDNAEVEKIANNEGLKLAANILKKVLTNKKARQSMQFVNMID